MRIVSDCSIEGMKITIASPGWGPWTYERRFLHWTCRREHEGTRNMVEAGGLTKWHAFQCAAALFVGHFEGRG